jgi:hypothetical protein
LWSAPKIALKSRPQFNGSIVSFADPQSPRLCQQDQAETSVLFELISAGYQRRSTLITANQPFCAWSKVFGDPAWLAVVDCLVHHATIFAINVDS